MAEKRAERVRALAERRGEIANRDVARALGVSAATAHRLLHALATRGVLERRGKGPAACYRLRPVRRRFRIAGLAEDRAWREVAEAMARIRPLTPAEATGLRYAATEVINNAIEHSEGSWVSVSLDFLAAGTTRAIVRDDGIGVFRRICRDFGFSSPQDAIVRLEQGKLTTDPERHSGEGLFFSSKAVARFRLESGGVGWVVDNVARDSALAQASTHRGTQVTLEVERGKTPRLEDVFREYTDPETLRFTRTRATIKLGAFGAALVSRSEARRIVAGLTKFERASLDFSGVDLVGQGFCDEVFRVFAGAHPEIALEPVGMNDAVAFMVARARGRPLGASG